MRGHTSDRIIRGALKSLITASERECKLRADFRDEVEFFKGRIDSLRELAILLAIDLGV